MNKETAEEFSRIFKSIADPSRQKILVTLRHEGELSVNALVELLGVSQPTVSQHLRILKELGAVVSHKAGQQVFYRLRSERFCDAMTEFVRIYRAEIKSSTGTGASHD